MGDWNFQRAGNQLIVRWSSLYYSSEYRFPLNELGMANLARFLVENGLIAEIRQLRKELPSRLYRMVRDRILIAIAFGESQC